MQRLNVKMAYSPGKGQKLWKSGKNIGNLDTSKCFRWTTTMLNACLGKTREYSCMKFHQVCARYMIHSTAPKQRRSRSIK